MSLSSAISPATPTTVALSIASPCVVTWANHNVWPGSAIILFSSGALPTGLSALTIYYVLSSGFTLSSFQIAATPGGAAINTSGTQSGTQSAVALLNGLPGALPAVASSALESNHVLKASAGGLLAVTVSIGAVSGWVLIFDATSAPADGAVAPIWWMPVDSNGTNGYATFAWEPAALAFLTGCTVVFSTTGPFTKTASATAAFSGQVQ